MELTSFLVFCGFVIFSVIFIIVVSVFGMHEKSYDEVVVEQRSKDQGNGLILKNGKGNKDKKKKNSKKQKEKSAESAATINVAVAKIKSKPRVATLPLAEVKPLSVTKPVVLQTKNVKSMNNKLVEIEPELKSVPVKKIIKKEIIETDKEKGKNKKNAAKPIKAEVKPQPQPLKAETKPVKIESKTIKTELKPKIENKSIKSEIKVLKVESKTTKKEPKAPVVNPKANKTEAKQKEVNSKVETKGVKAENKSVSEGRNKSQKNNSEVQKKNVSKIDESASVPPSPTKRAKKLKYDLSSGDNGMNGIHLATVLRNAILTDAELQTLIEILLNRQQEGESWIKMGQKIDPFSALKKQLQETEQKLADEQMTSQTTSNKLKELRQELTKTSQMERSSREKFVASQQELQNLHLHYQHQHDQHVSELNGLQIKFQQVQVKSSEEHRLALQHVQEENEKLKQALAQMEANSKSLTSNEIARLQCDVEQWRITCEQYKEQLTSSQQGDNERQQHMHQLQQCIKDLKNQAGQQEKATQQEMNDLLKQLSQSESNRNALQRDLSLYQNVQTENNTLHNKIRDMEKTNNNICQRIQELEDQVHNAEANLNVCMKENDVKQQEAQHDFDQVHQNNEMLKMKIEETMKDIVAKESLLTKQENDLAQYLDEVQQVTKELNIQREKNNEINRLLSRFVPGRDYDVSQSAANLKDELMQVKQIAEESEKTLKLQVKQCQEALSETETALHNLQRRAEDEELVWKEKLAYTENDLKQYEERLEDLQGKLLIEENERKLTELKATEMRKSFQNFQEIIDAKTKEILKREEVENSLNKRLSELEAHLKVEKKSVKDLTTQAVKLNSLVRIGEDSLKAEQKVVRELEKKLTDQKTLKTTSNGTSNDEIGEVKN
uniref:Ribosome receptor lysine/proline rich domain-containing protein n=1 Tax=Strigamia maritima TaxID=126957 RepID=T1J0T7_STRMM